jgi:DNA-binding beta-propeller fold protein YncE
MEVQNPPKGIALNQTEGCIYVATTSSSIRKYRVTEDSLVSWVSFIDGSPAEESGLVYCLKQPTGIAIDASGNVYIADSMNSRILKFSGSGGARLANWSYPSSDGVLARIQKVSVAPDGTIYTLIHKTYLSGSGAPRFFVAKFNSSGVKEQEWSSWRDSRGEQTFNNPNGLTCLGANTILVSDSGNNRLVVFDNNGRYMRSSIGLGLNFPAGVAATSGAASGSFFVADKNNNRIVVCDESLTRIIATIGRAGTGNGEFDHPEDIAVSSSGNIIYVADTNNCRVQKLSSISLPRGGVESDFSVETTPTVPLMKTKSFVPTTTTLMPREMRL